jgi:hypothetical protein
MQIDSYNQINMYLSESRQKMFLVLWFFLCIGIVILFDLTLSPLIGGISIFYLFGVFVLAAISLCFLASPGNFGLAGLSILFPFILAGIALYLSFSKCEGLECIFTYGYFLPLLLIPLVHIFTVLGVTFLVRSGQWKAALLWLIVCIAGCILGLSWIATKMFS